MRVPDRIAPSFARASAPKHRRTARREIAHGVERTDEYAWMRALNWKEALADPSKLPSDIRAALDEENAYAEETLAPLSGLRAALAAELRGRIKEDEAEPPVPDGPFCYYTCHRVGGQHPLYCRLAREGGPQTILLDGDAEAQGRDFFAVGDVAHSPDHRALAWTFDESGGEEFALRVRDLADGRDGPILARRIEGDPVWRCDSRGLLYVALDDDHRPTRVMRVALDAPEATPELVLEERDPRFFLSLEQSASGRYAVIASHDHDSTQVWLVDLAEPAAAPRLVAPRVPGRRVEVDHWRDRLIVTVGDGDAVDFRIVEAPLDAPRLWRDLVPHEPGRMIVDVAVFDGHLARLERVDASPRIVVRCMETGAEHVVAFDEEAYDLAFGAMHEHATTTLRFIYSSPARPREVWDYDMASGERVLLQRQELPSGHDPHAYVVRRVHALSHDGARVPITLLHRRDVPYDGTAPALLYGYGAYGTAVTSSFSVSRLSLADRGVVCAVAHVRGGSDKGFGWYLDGKLEKKTNSFLDFVACARRLVDLRVCAPDRLAAQGGSAGGLLMGAVANMAPELFAAIVAEVPFVDVMATMMDEHLPLTPPEWLEWGDPIRDAEAFRRMLSYSPYDNVGEKPYPPILALAGVSDPRVTYWEPLKWVARLRARSTGGGPTVLRVNMHAGHAGAAGRFDRIEEIALIYAFLLSALKAPAAPLPPIVEQGAA